MPVGGFRILLCRCWGDLVQWIVLALVLEGSLWLPRGAT